MLEKYPDDDLLQGMKISLEAACNFSLRFAEAVKKSCDGTKDEKKKEALRNYAATIVTKRRAEKLLQKMVEDQIIPENWDEHDMGTIAKNINRLMYNDCKKEEPETVMAIENFGKIRVDKKKKKRKKKK